MSDCFFFVFFFCPCSQNLDRRLKKSIVRKPNQNFWQNRHIFVKKKMLCVIYTYINILSELSVCLSVCLPVCLFVCIYVCMSVCQYDNLCVCLSVQLSICLYVCISVHLSVYKIICLSVCKSLL